MSRPFNFFNRNRKVSHDTTDCAPKEFSFRDQVIEMPCLGIPFDLGMLYDCRNEKLIPTLTLWDPDQLKLDRNCSKRSATDSNVIKEDTFEEKAKVFGIGGELKLSVLTGMLALSGSAKYLTDFKKTSRQIRFSLQYSFHSEYKELTMKHLNKVNATYKDVFCNNSATHVVTGVLYGAEAYFVFNTTTNTQEESNNIKGMLKGTLENLVGKIAAYIADPSAEADIHWKTNDKTLIDNFACTYRGDFILETNPTTLEEVLKIYKELPTMLNDSSKVNIVPKKVWLLPLTKLDSKAAKLAREISAGIITQACNIIELLQEQEIILNDYASSEICQLFPNLKSHFSTAKVLLNEYRTNFQKNLASILTDVRSGKREEAVIANLLRTHQQSLFSDQKFGAWLNSKKEDMDTLLACSKKLKDSFRFFSKMSDIAEIAVLEGKNILCLKFAFPKEDPYLKQMQTLMQNPTVAVSQFAHKPFLDNISSLMLTKLFYEFAMENKDLENVIYLVAHVDGEECCQNSTAISVYHTDMSESNFNPPSSPVSLQTHFTSNNSITVSWKVERSDSFVKEYEIHYGLYKNEEINKWNVQKFPGGQNVAEIKGLAPNTAYAIKIRACTEVGRTKFSETLQSVLTRKGSVTRAKSHYYKTKDQS